MNIGDLVKLKQGGRGRPRKWVVTDCVTNDMGMVEVTAYDSSGDVLNVPIQDVLPYPEKKEFDKSAGHTDHVIYPHRD